MSASITLRPEGLPRIEAALGLLVARHEDLSPLMDVIGMAMETSTLQRFEDEEGPDGVSWEPSLRARETGGKTLTDTARLKLSITHRAGRDEVEVGTNVIYAGAHQNGAVIRGKNGPLKFKLPGGLGFRTIDQVVIPARPFLGISGEDQDETEALIQDYSIGGIA